MSLVGKPHPHPICPSCGNFGKILTEKKINGVSRCMDCAHKGKTEDFYKANPLTEEE